MANDNGGGFVIGFLLGGVIGAVVGILLAPKPGSETRAEIMGQSEAWRERAEELAAQLRERVGPTVETMRERVGPAVEGVRERVAPVAERVTTRARRRPARTAADTGSQADGAGESGTDGAEAPA
jgi:gas vesicle protein